MRRRLPAAAGGSAAVERAQGTFRQVEGRQVEGRQDAADAWARRYESDPEKQRELAAFMLGGTVFDEVMWQLLAVPVVVTGAVVVSNPAAKKTTVREGSSFAIRTASVGDAIAVFFAASKGVLARPSLSTDWGGWKGKFDSR